MKKLVFALAAAACVMRAGAFEVTSASIVLPEAPTEVERYAASELVKYVKASTGVTLPVAAKAGGAAIRLVRERGELGEDGFRLRTTGRDLIVAGGSRGLLYGVYELLERHGGIEWLSAVYEIVPKKSRLTVPDGLDVVSKPAFFYRASSWADLRLEPAFQAKMRINGVTSRATPPGGLAAVFCKRLGVAHTFEKLVPTSVWFKRHPEYFSEVNGVRRAGMTQLCLTNPDVEDIVVSNVLEAVAKDQIPSDRSVQYLVGVSQNDWQYFCECDKCRAVDEAEGSHAGTLCRFVNRVAERVEAKRPGTYVETLIYQYTRKPPKAVRLRHNVVPCLCSIECSFASPLAERTLPVNSAFMEDLAEWGRRSDNLYVWDYTTDYNHFLYPMPNVGALQPNMQAFRKHGAKYLFEEGCGSHGAYFQELKSWLIAKLMWDPDQPLEPLLKRFFAGYYGAAAPHVRACFDELEASVRKDPKTRLTIWEHDRPKLLPDAEIVRLRGMLAKAAEAVRDDAERLAHVRAVEASLACVWVDRHGAFVKRFWVTRHPERFALKDGLREDVARLRRFLADGKERGRVVEIANRADKCERAFEIWRAIENFSRPALGSDRLFLGTDDLHYGGWKYGHVVKDPAAVGGRAIEAWNYAEGEAASVHFGNIAFDPEANYRVRLRIKCRRAENGRGEAFNCILGGGNLRRRIEEVKDGWQWYEFPKRKLHEGLRLDFCSGRFKEGGGSSAVKGVMIDAVEIVREPDAEPLAAGFARPPRNCRPEVWWWASGLDSAPEAAIVRDLEAMKRVGMTGFHIYGGSATDAAWRKKAVFAIGEAARIGLDAYLLVGCAGCGHKDTPLEFAPKDLVFTVRTAKAVDGVMSVDLPRSGRRTTPKDADGRPALYTDIVTLAVPARVNAPMHTIRDVSKFLDAEHDRFVWKDAPGGTWQIVRFAWVPLKFGWSGCYIDHLSREAMDNHWARVVTPLLDELSPSARKALKGVLCDSWEAETCSWTQRFAEEFRSRRGYDLTKWLAAKAGIKVGEPAARSAFLRDFDETVSELLADNHYGYKTELAHRHGLVHVAEACGPHQKLADVRRLQGRCDVAMGEFWMPSNHRPSDPQRFMLRDAATSAHVYGMGEVLAESFTTIHTYWTEAPADLKPCADRAFCDGLTRACYHGMMLSPSLTDRPGKIRAAAQHYNPQNTWFEQSRALNEYLARCSWMLSRGRFAADALVYAGDAINVFASLKDTEDALGAGFDYDFCPTELLLKARVENGEIVLPSGMRYRTVVIADKDPGAKRMSPGKPEPPATRTFRAPFIPKAAEAALRRFEQAGVPVLRTREARRQWVAAQLPDFAAEGDPLCIDWIHRRLDDGDIYFVSNLSNVTRSVNVLLRAQAPSVELWDAVTGDRALAEAETTADGRTRVRIDFAANCSVFAVLGKKPSPGVRRMAQPKPVQEISGPWQVTFDPKWSRIDRPLVFSNLVDWTRHPLSGVRHYSGTATYAKTMGLSVPEGAKRIYLDLGAVGDVAEVSVNGRDCGIAWTAPYRVDITAAVANRQLPAALSVKITNRWPNRLIGDGQEPKHKRLARTNMNPYKWNDPLLPSGLFGPVRILAE